MALLYFKLFHIIGAICLFLGFGGLLAIGENRPNINKLVSGLNGAGLLLLFVAGFGMQGMGKMGFPLWLIIKIVLWVVMIFLFVFAKKGKIPTQTAVIVALLMGGVITWLCLLKPFV